MAAKPIEATRTAEDIIGEVQASHDFPLTAYVELTRRCNLRCQHCLLDLDSHPGLAHERLLGLWDELAAAGVLFLVLTGGEATVRPDWLDLARAARDRGFSIRLKTNAAALSQEDIKEISLLPVLAVDVSLYGAKASVHDAVTRTPGSFDATLKSVGELRLAGVRVSLRTPLMKVNGPHIGDILSLAEQLGCEAAFDPGVMGRVDGSSDLAEYRIDQPELARALSTLVDRGLLQLPCGDGGSPQNCLELRRTIYVCADGEVWPCPALPVSIGNVEREAIADVYHRSVSLEELLRETKKVPDACRACETRGACQRCFGRSYLEHRTLAKPASTDCTLARCLYDLSLARRRRECDTPDGGA